MFNTIRHLLPNGRAWRATIDKILRRFLVGLGEGLQAFRVNFDDIADDLYPPTTRLLDDYEEQFGLYPSTLSAEQRRDRIDAAWKARGGQSPRYIQDTLRASGFDVYVHDWWFSAGSGVSTELGSSELGPSELWSGEGGYEARNPFDVLSDAVTATGFNVVSNGEIAITNNPAAITGATGAPTGYLLVNLPTNTDYLIPADPTKWPFIIYIGGQVWGSSATIASGRRDEFEALCLKICPLQLWIGLIVEYS